MFSLAIRSPGWFTRYLLFGVVLASLGHAVSASETPPPPTVELPVSRVVLFTSGVAYFEHLGQVQGDARVELQCVDLEINDLLKSLIVEDLDGGQARGISYAAHDPQAHAQRAFAIDMTAEPSLAQLLSQLRGQSLEVDAPQLTTGVIVGVEQRPRVQGGEVVPVTMLNLLTDAGLVSIDLASVTRLRLANPALDAELRGALAALARGRADRARTVSAEFRGAGQRRVRLGYVREAPLWKTSYRLLLDPEGAPRLQGWAIVENASAADWQNVRLSLVSGRPISFVMDLYQSLYLERPVVMPELYVGVRSQVASRDLLRRVAGAPAELDKERGDVSDQAAALGMSDAMSEMREGAQVAQPAMDRAEEAEPALGGLGVTSQALAAEVGEAFEYAIAAPVTLPRQQAAMLPIVTAEVQAEKLSLFQPGAHPRHPLHAVQLTNTTGVYWMQGPMTVFDGGTYAGDGRIHDVAQGARRLVTYALDMRVEVRETTEEREELTLVNLVDGLLWATYTRVRTNAYHAQNDDQQPRALLVEQPREDAWKLIEPATPDEQAHDVDRFRLSVPAAGACDLVVRRTLSEARPTRLVELDDATMEMFITATAVRREVRDALGQIVARRRALAKLAERQASLLARLEEINQHQQRIRENMSRLDHTNDLYKTYVRTLSEQEQEIAQLHDGTAKLRVEVALGQADFETFVSGLRLVAEK